MAAASVQAGQVPANTTLEVRLQQEINSYSSKNGSTVQAVTIAPILVDGKTVLPAGALIIGELDRVHRVGVGFIHESASFDIHWNQLQLSDGTKLPIQAKTTEIDNPANQWIGTDTYEPIDTAPETLSTEVPPQSTVQRLPRPQNSIENPWFTPHIEGVF
jgi:hypothetical protein